jgi:hypothetical protein
MRWWWWFVVVKRCFCQVVVVPRRGRWRTVRESCAPANLSHHLPSNLPSPLPSNFPSPLPSNLPSSLPHTYTYTYTHTHTHAHAQITSQYAATNVTALEQMVGLMQEDPQLVVQVQLLFALCSLLFALCSLLCCCY